MVDGGVISERVRWASCAEVAASGTVVPVRGTLRIVRCRVFCARAVIAHRVGALFVVRHPVLVQAFGFVPAEIPEFSFVRAVWVWACVERDAPFERIHSLDKRIAAAWFSHGGLHTLPSAEHRWQRHGGASPIPCVVWLGPPSSGHTRLGGQRGRMCCG